MNAGDPFGAGALGGARAVLGVPVLTSDAMWDGETAIANGWLLVGTGPIPPREQTRREAVRIVQQGMADVLAWLGWPPWTPPATSREVLDSLARLDPDDTSGDARAQR